ncbi:hypothetical protein RI129_009409 [Pyrocoelia pectoralis]|uniref:Carboxylesterase type B domain-containing protein n=1 Tax=Pyrocoelia pectoralis TaxID=417401 RepID=A0AAN7ZEV3_9COLE
MSKTSIITLVSSLIVSTLSKEHLPTVNIAQGTLQGGIGLTQNNGTYFYFTGIPYAAAPVGEYRFEPPVAASAWNGILNATRPHNVCPQFQSKYDKTKMIGNEDCLYLNIYTPRLTEYGPDLLPVMFFIEGEEFEFSNPNKAKYGPELLLNKDVVLVTVGYRLGALGFFLTAGPTVRGNMGLKDQAFALNWVKENIIHFGGNPKKTTVFGSGAGSASAHYHMISPLSRNLINGVITESGTAFNSWALTPIQVLGINCKVLSGFAGCSASATVTQMVNCLKLVNASDILSATAQFSGYGVDSIFKPVIEMALDGAFISKDPIKSVRTGEVANVPIIMGITTGSGVIDATNLLEDPETIQQWRDDFNEMASKKLYYGDTAIVSERPVISSKIKDFYFNKTEIGEASKDDVINMFTDGLFLEGIRSSLDLHIKYHNKPIYNYLFGYRGNVSYINKNNEVTFKDELLYLFKNTLDFPNYVPSAEDEEVSDLLTSLWVNFATYGDPTPSSNSSVKWRPAEKGRENYYYIKSGSEVEVDEGLFVQRAEFWRSLGLDSRRKDIRDNL